jgi:multiple antibiotic resistance protein
MEPFFLALASLIVVIGPWKAAIVFAERTASMPLATRRLVAIATVVISLVIAVVFLLVGDDVVKFFHITPAAFQVAAGLLILVFAIRMVILDEKHEEPVDTSDESGLQTRAWGLAAYPLSVPLLITPAAITTLVALSVQADISAESSAALAAAVLVVMVFNLLVFLAEAQWGDLVPYEVWSIAGRVLGVLLAGFGVTLIIAGIKASGLVGQVAATL